MECISYFNTSTPDAGEKVYDVTEGDEGGPWLWRIPMWRGMASHEMDRVEAIGRTGGKVRVESSREPFMVPSGHNHCEDLGGGGSMDNDIRFFGMW
jgi:hypothetical protein